MKKLALVLTLALVLAFAVPVFANPFSDVPADHWAYDAISKLAADGVITGNPDGTYTGKKNLTRYEIAVIVAKAMASAEANADQVTAENQATIDKLAAEFGKELTALGVKVAALEKKIGNVKFTGDSRLRYRQDTNDAGQVAPGKSWYEGRFRLKATAIVNDKTTVTTRLTTDDYNFSDAASTNPNAKMDRFYVQYANNGVTVAAGRLDAKLGKLLIIDDAIKGITVSAPVGNYKATLMTGRLDSDVVGKKTGLSAADAYTLTALQFDGIKLGNATLGFDYGTVKSKTNKTAFAGDDEVKLVAVNFDYALNKKINLFGEYVKSDLGDDLQKAYQAGIQVKKIMKKTDLTVTYAELERNAIIAPLGTFGSFERVIYSGNQFATYKDKTEIVKFRLDHALMPSTNLYAEYSTGEGKTAGENTKQNGYRFETGLEFKF